MRKRVTVGFLSIVCLLFFSGMVSFVELSHLSRDTGEILKANMRNIELAKEMLDAAHEQYNDEYVALYGRLTSAIKNYMTSTQSSLAPRAEQMKKNAYRAVTPVLISLAVMIAIVLMLYYFMSVYCVNPILRMNKGLGDYLSFRVPFVVKADCKDEMLELKEKIETLITISKQPKA